MEQIFGAIPAIVRDLEDNGTVDEAVVFAAWARCAGEMLRERTAPAAFRNKKLVVTVQDKTWQRHLEELSPQMLAKLNMSLGQGTVTFIEFRIDPKSLSHAANARKKLELVAEPTPEIDAALRESANAIRDEQLREHFLSTAAVYLDRQRQL